MKKILTILAALGVAGSFAFPAFADPQTDLKEFQGYFKKTYPTVKFDEFSNGLYALPAYKTYREQWESANEFPAYELGLTKGTALWQKKFPNGESFDNCVKKGAIKPAYTYPRWDKATKSLRVAELDIMDCAKANNADPKVLTFLTADLNKDTKARVQLAEVTAHFYSMYKGKRVKPDVDFNDKDVLAAYENGKRHWWARRGQLNFACAHCHLDLAGKDMANQPLSAGLGHTTAWPAQRYSWARLETIMKRYETCNSQVRDKPDKHYSPTYLNLQLYETYMSSGLPLTAPSMRN
jgi:sulfur-oxidizing protein SoxA